MFRSSFVLRLSVNSITVLGIRIDDVIMSEALARADDFMQEPRVHQIVTVNPEFIVAAQQDPNFAETLKESDLNLPDGANLLRAAQAQGDQKVAEEAQALLQKNWFGTQMPTPDQL